MKQYLLFAGDHYYPSGGWNDFIDSYATMEEVEKQWATLSNNKVYDWGHVVDITKGQSTRL